MHLHIDANRIDIKGNVNDAHYIYERAMAAAAKVGQQRGWKDAQEVSRQNKEAITNDCLSVLTKMPYFDWGLYTKCLTQMGYDVKLQSDSKGQVRGYAIMAKTEHSHPLGMVVSTHFRYKKDVNGSDSKYSSINYMPADGSDIVSLISTKTDNVPTQMVTKEGIVYFSFPNDSILELLYDDGKTVTMLDSIAYSKEKLQEISNANSNDAFKSVLASTASLLKKKETSRSISSQAITDLYGTVFEEVSGEPYVQNDEIVKDITTNESGNYEFTETIR